MSRGAPSTLEKLPLPISGTDFVDNEQPLVHRKKSTMADMQNYIRMLEWQLEVVLHSFKRKLAKAKSENTELREEIKDLERQLDIFIKEAGTEQFQIAPETIDWQSKLQKKKVDFKHINDNARKFFQTEEYVIEKPKTRTKKDSDELSDDEASAKPAKKASSRTTAAKPKTTRKPRKAADEPVQDNVEDELPEQAPEEIKKPGRKPRKPASTAPVARAASDVDDEEQPATPAPTRVRRAPPTASSTAKPSRVVRATPTVASRKTTPAQQEDYSESDVNDDFAIAK